MAISLRLSTCRGTIIATATRLPRCARNDMRKTERPCPSCNSSDLRGSEQLTAGGEGVEHMSANRRSNDDEIATLHWQ